MYLREKMQIYLNTVCMLAQLIFMKIRNHRLDQSIIYLKTSLLSFENILMKILQKNSFEIPSL
jgi:hypothetical protein